MYMYTYIMLNCMGKFRVVVHVLKVHYYITIIVVNVLNCYSVRKDPTTECTLCH